MNNKQELLTTIQQEQSETQTRLYKSDIILNAASKLKFNTTGTVNKHY